MHGAGTKDPAILARAMVPLLDITRLMSRAGRVLTGVDRVELAYLDHLLGLDAAWGLARTGLGFLLLDTAGLAAFRARLETGDWGKADALSRWSRRLDPVQKAAVSRVRAAAVARCRPRDLARLIRGSGATDSYNRILNPKTGEAAKRKHTETYQECSWVCPQGQGSCMLYVPYKKRYGASKAACLKVKE